MEPIRSQLERMRRVLREDDTLRNVLKSSGWLTGSSAVLIGLSTVQGVLTARILGVALWGTLALALAFASVAGRLMSFRMDEFVIKWVTHFTGDQTPKAATTFKIALACDVLSGLIAFAVVELVAGWGASVFAKSESFTWVFQLVALVLVFQAGQQSLIGMLHLNRDFRTQSLVQVGSQAASACGVVGVYLTGGGLLGIVVVFIGAAALTSVLMWAFGLRAARTVLGRGWMRQKVVRLGGIWRSMARFAVLGNFSGTLSVIMNESDLLLLGYFRNPLEVSYYKLAKSIVQIAAMPMMPLVNATYPEFAKAATTRSWDKFRTLMRRGSKTAVLWFLPVSVGLVILVRPAIAVLYGESFLPAAFAFDILLIGVVVDGVLFWTRRALLAMGEPGYPAAVNSAAMVTKLLLVFLLVPVGGYLAMAAIWSLVLIVGELMMARHTLAGLRIRESRADG